MYEDYLTNLETYLALEGRFQSEHLNHILKNKYNKNDFSSPFYITRFQNGQIFGDANPIFSARNNKSKKIIRIILEEDEQEITTIIQTAPCGLETILFGDVSHLEKLIEKANQWTDESAA